MNPSLATVILMVDDSPFFAGHVERLCAARVAGEGGAWGWAQTPAEGLAQAERLRPALVLLDPAMHGDEKGLEDYCRELAKAAAPGTPALLFLNNPTHLLDGLLRRLGTADGMTVGALAKPFGPPELTAKIDALLRTVSESTPTPAAMPDPYAPASRYSWLTSTPEVTGYAHLTADGAVVEWSGTEKDQGPHGALVYLQSLAGVCGGDLGLGPVAEVHTIGPRGCGLAVNLGGNGTLNVLASPRANLRDIASRTVEAVA